MAPVVQNYRGVHPSGILPLRELFVKHVSSMNVQKSCIPCMIFSLFYNIHRFDYSGTIREFKKVPTLIKTGLIREVVPKVISMQTTVSYLRNYHNRVIFNAFHYFTKSDFKA